MWAPGGPGLPRAHPMMLEAQTGTVVWQGPSLGWETMGPTVQTCNGTEYITFWAGAEIDNRKAGVYHVYDSNYRPVFNVTSKGALEYADAHEIYFTPQCTAIITTYQTRAYNLSHYGIENGWLMDSYFQEIDLATDKLLFQWEASEHINVTDAIWLPPVKDQGKSENNGYDFLHLNSVEKDRFGNYLLSARHTNNLYYISGVNGNVIWTLGGLRNDFTDLSDGNATNFAWQHHARWVDANMTKISLFDDRSSAYHTTEHNLTRGIIISVDTTAKTVKLDKAYYATQGIQAMREGSMQVLDDSPEPGNVILGYGHEPAWTEYAPNGTVLFDIAFGPMGRNRASADNYRAIKVNWTGLPTFSPSIAAGPEATYTFHKKSSTFAVQRRNEEGQYLQNTTAYLSWNGATNISYWVILASNDSLRLDVSSNFVAKVDKSGFETNYLFPNTAKYVQALAVNGSDFVLGTTSLLELASGNVLALSLIHI